MSRYGILALRISLDGIFIWFGALKMIGDSPVYDLVASTVYLVPPEFFVPLLGFWEIAVGFGLLTGLALPLPLVFLLTQVVGAFLVLVVKTQVAFQGLNPLLFTTEGEFVVKNIVLISGALVVGSTICRRELKDGGERDHK